MTTFDKREEGFEKKFAHDEELKFKATPAATSCSACGRPRSSGTSGADAEAYAKEVVMADFEEAGDDDVFRKVRKDFDAKGVAQSDHQIRRTMDELMAQAVEQIRAGTIARAGSAIQVGHAYVSDALMPMAALPGFSLARRLRAGETVYTGWCGLPAPIVAEIVAREGFSAVTLDRSTACGTLAGDSRPASPPIRAGRRGADRARAARRLRDGEPRARFRRRRHHRADDQHRGRCARLRGGGEISADRRAQLGPAPRHDARRHRRPEGLSARGQRQHRHLRDDRDPHRARQSRRDRGDAGHRRAVPRAVRPLDRAVERRSARSACRRTVDARARYASSRPRRRPARSPAPIAPMPSARVALRQARHALSRGRQRHRRSCAPARAAQAQEDPFRRASMRDDPGGEVVAAPRRRPRSTSPASTDSTTR